MASHPSDEPTTKVSATMATAAVHTVSGPSPPLAVVPAPAVIVPLATVGTASGRAPVPTATTASATAAKKKKSRKRKRPDTELVVRGVTDGGGYADEHDTSDEEDSSDDDDDDDKDSSSEEEEEEEPKKDKKKKKAKSVTRKSEESDSEPDEDTADKKAKSGRKAGANDSEYARVSRGRVDQWLRQPVPVDRDEALRTFLRRPDLPSRVVFTKLVPITVRQLMAIWKHAQKSEFWLRARIPRKTGSDGGTLLDWNPYCNPLKQAWRKIYGEFIENEATEHGNEWEKPAAKEYIQEFQRTLNRWFIEQRAYETGVMVIYGRRFQLTKRTPTSPYYSPPHAQLWHIGMVVDPFNHWRGASIDGLVTINGIPLILVEIKCPYSLNTSLYINEPMYYVPQGQDGLYAMSRLYPTCAVIHRVTFSPMFGMNVDTFVMDPAWYMEWYAPRELRYYFGPLIKMLSEHLVFRFLEKHSSLKPQPFIDFLLSECALPDEPTSHPAHAKAHG